MTNDPHKDPPLPSTAQFIIFLGLFLVFGWLAMYLLLRSRWVF